MICLRHAGRFLVLSAVISTFYVRASDAAEATATALLRHAPAISGIVEGSVQQMTGEGVTLGGGAWSW